MPSQTLSFQITGNSASASQAFKDAAAAAAIASKAAKDLGDRLALQSKTAQVAAGATLSMVKADQLLADAEAELSGAASEARRKLAEQGDAAEKSALLTKLAADAAKSGGGAFSRLASPLGAAIAAGVALAPVLVTVGTGLGGLGVAAYGTVAPILAASQATGGLKANMATLSPVQQQMGRELLTLEGQASAFSKSLQPQVTTLWGDAVAFAGGALHDIQPVAKATGDALHGVLVNLGGDLHGQEWQQFFQFMSATAAPDVQLLGMNFEQVLNLLPPLLENLQPLGTELLQTTGGVLQLANVLVKVEGAVTNFGGSASAAASPVGKLYGAVKGAVDLMMPVTGALRAASGLMTEFDGSTTKAAKATGSLSANAAHAAPVIGTLSGDMALLDSTTGNATTQLSAFSDMWNLIVGNSLSDQQAVLADAQAFATLQADIKKSGASSVTSQQAFVAYAQQVITTTETLVKNKASVQDVNSAYKTNIANLQSLHNLTPVQRQDIAGIVTDYGKWASTTAGLSRNTLAAAHTITTDFLGAMDAAAQKSPQVKSDIEALSNSILKTGTTSASTASDRARLIADLEHAGLNAQGATALVGSLQQNIDGLHGKSVNVDLTTSGHGQIIITGTGISQRIIDTATGTVHHGGTAFAARGTYVATGAGPHVDDYPAMLARGELVVPAHMVSAGEVDHLRGRIPGFAAGGIAGAESGIGTAEAQWGQLAAQALAQGAIQAAAKAAAATAGFQGGAPATGSAAAAQAFAQSILPGGWSWPDLQALWQRESGWNAWAVNPSSGAYGIPQSLGHGHPYNLGDYANQVRWGIGYIATRPGYGNSQNAWAHEQAAGWYGSGLDAVVSRPTVIGVGERGPERVRVTPVTAGRGSAGGTPAEMHFHFHGPVGSKAEAKNWVNGIVDELAREGRLTYALRRSPSAG